MKLFIYDFILENQNNYCFLFNFLWSLIFMSLEYYNFGMAIIIFIEYKGPFCVFVQDF